jgi:hypothetical protein
MMEQYSSSTPIWLFPSRPSLPMVNVQHQFPAAIKNNVRATNTVGPVLVACTDVTAQHLFCCYVATTALEHTLNVEQLQKTTSINERDSQAASITYANDQMTTV